MRLAGLTDPEVDQTGHSSYVEVGDPDRGSDGIPFNSMRKASWPG